MVLGFKLFTAYMIEREEVRNYMLVSQIYFCYIGVPVPINRRPYSLFFIYEIEE